MSNKVYSNFVPNYKTIASVYSIFQNGLPIKDRVLLEESIVDQMSASLEVEQETQQPIDSLILGSFITKFNEEYSQELSEDQRILLENYIISFEDNGLELKVYLNEEIQRLKNSLNTINENLKEESLKKKVQDVYTVLDNTKNQEIDTEVLEIVLNTQKLVEDIQDNDN